MHPDAAFDAAGAAGQQGSDHILRIVVRFAIFTALAAMAVMAFTRNVNWDEFYFLSHVHAHLDGRLDRPLQTFFVHGFGWLPMVSGHEVDQITAARLVMLAFFVGTCVSIHRIAAKLTDVSSADMAVLAFVTAGFAIPHGGSFRADPMAASLLMAALALMMTTRMGLWQSAAVAVLSALALLVTVKSALYLPVFLAALLWRWPERGVVLRCLLAGVSALALAGALFVWHSTGIVAVQGASDNLSEAARVTLGGSGLLPRLPEVSLWALFSIGGLLLAVAGIVLAPPRRLQIVLVLFAAPLLTVVLYRNAFPYFFPFAVPALMVCVALGAQALKGSLIWKLGLVLMLAGGATQTLRAYAEDNAAQRTTIAEVHRLFPQSVSYIDQNGMMASFERQGFFMSTWGIAVYRAAGKPVFGKLIAEHQPPLLLANRDELYLAMRPERDSGETLGLLADDAEVLRASYVHHAGVIWLAGQESVLNTGQATMNLPFAGRYRLEAEGPVTVDGTEMSPDEVRRFDGGPLAVTAPEGTKVRLIWNTAPGLAPKQLPETDLYAGFWRL
ncbi:MAG: hypothetical protein AB8B60_04290 [Sulfitobacter sp.]